MWPVTDRTTVILSAICAVWDRFSLKTMPGILVLTTPSGPRYSMGASGFGSHDSCARQAAGQNDLNDTLRFALGPVHAAIGQAHIASGRLGAEIFGQRETHAAQKPDLNEATPPEGGRVTGSRAVARLVFVHHGFLRRSHPIRLGYAASVG